jgi:hypothetical protein
MSTTAPHELPSRHHLHLQDVLILSHHPITTANATTTSTGAVNGSLEGESVDSLFQF